MSGFAMTQVHFSYGTGQPVLRGVDLCGRPGEVLGFLGNNGAGKTTSFRILAGLLRPDAGDVQVAGISVLEDSRAARQTSAYVPDEPLVYPNLSALENLNMFGLLWGVPSRKAKERGEALLHEVGLWPMRHQWTRTYSRGMRQKLSLCAALLHSPKVLLMDEPFTGLDIDGALWARNLLRTFTAEGGAVLLTSHTPEIIDALADRVAILREGRIAYDQDRECVRRDGGVLTIYKRVSGILEAVS